MSGETYSPHGGNQEAPHQTKSPGTVDHLAGLAFLPMFYLGLIPVTHRMDAPELGSSGLDFSL